MASFTDKPMAFNPYVQELPVDDYVRVGMEKQQQYNQGVATVKAADEQIAGLDVAKDEDRKYLNSRLAQLQSETNRVAGGDFSKAQLVNGLTGLARTIGNDKIIKGAVVSTQQFRKGQQQIAEAKTSGKGYGVENEAMFNKQAADWMNDKQAGSSFSGSYTPYVDVKKKVLDVIKAFAPESTLTEMPFVTDTQGNVKLDANGQPQLDRAMVERTVKGRDASALANAIHQSLDENDIRQLGISGWYHYRNYTPEDFKGVIDANTKARGEQLIQHRNSLRIDKTLNPSDADYQQGIDDQMSLVDQGLENINKDYTTSIKSLAADPEGFKGQFYTNNFVDGISKAFSPQSISEKIVESPKYKAYQEDRKFQLDVDKFNLEKEKFQAEKDGLIGNGKTTKKTKADGTPISGDDYPLDPSTVSTPTEYTFQDATTDKIKERDGLVTSLMGNIMGTGNLVTMHENAGASSKTGGMDINAMNGYFYEQMAKSWKNGAEVPQELQTAVHKINQLNKEIDINKTYLSTIKAKADKLYSGVDATSLANSAQGGTVKISKVDVQAAQSNPISYMVPIGTFIGAWMASKESSVDLNQQDILNLAIIRKNADPLLTSVEGKRARLDAIAALNKKYGEETSDQLAESVTNFKRTPFFSDKAANVDLSSVNDQINKVASLVDTQKYKDRQKYISDQLSQSQLLGKPIAYDLTTGEPKDGRNVANQLTNIIVNKSQAIDGKDIPDQSKMKEILNDKAGVSFQIVRQPKGDLNDAQYQVIMSSKGASGSAKLPLTQRQAESLLGEKFDTTDTDLVKTKIMNSVATDGKRTTNPSNDPMNAYYNPDTFKNVDETKYTMAGDISEDILNLGNYFATVYIKPKNGEKWVKKELKAGGGKPLAAVQQYIAQLNTANVEQLLSPTAPKN